MHHASTVAIALAAAVAAGCTISPPPPPKAEGDYRPINRLSNVPLNTSIPRVFDLDYSGSLEGALVAIRKQQPQVRIEPSEGERKVVNIKIAARQVTLENALQLLARETKGVAEIIHRPDAGNKIDTVLVRYK